MHFILRNPSELYIFSSHYYNLSSFSCLKPKNFCPRARARSAHWRWLPGCVIQLSTQWTVENLQTNHSTLRWSVTCQKKEGKKGYMRSHGGACMQEAMVKRHSSLFSIIHARAAIGNCVHLKSIPAIYSLTPAYILQLSPTLIPCINLFERHIIILFFINSKKNLYILYFCRLLDRHLQKETFNIFTEIIFN